METIVLVGTVAAPPIDNTFGVHTLQTEIYYTCTYTGVVPPVEQGDVIYAMGQKTSDSSVHILFQPLIYLGTDADTVIRVFGEIFKSKVAKTTKEQLYKDLLYVHQRPDLLVKFLDAEAVERKGSKIGGLGRQHTTDLLLGWYRRRVLRACMVLGMTREQIQNCCIAEHLIPDLIRADPLKVYALPLITAESLYATRSEVPSEAAKQAGKVGRILFDICQSEKWVSIPVDFINQSFPIAPLLPELRFSVYENHLYLPERLEREKFVAEWLALRMQQPVTPLPNLNNLVLSPDQQTAVDIALSQPLTIIQGAAGTGKTRSIEQIVAAIVTYGAKCILTGPTGKSASRIWEVLTNPQHRKSIHVAHIHLLLAQHLKLDQYTFIIIDEFSMVSTDLFYKLLVELKHYPRLIVVGDANQLEPIDWGQPMRQMIASGVIPTATLTTNHRSVQSILYNAQQVLTDNPQFKWDENTFILPPGTKVLDVVKQFKIDEVRIISPLNKVVAEVNTMVQNYYFKDTQHSTDHRGFKWHCNERVLMRNNTDDILNGEEGIITQLRQSIFWVKYRRHEEPVQYTVSSNNGYTKSKYREDRDKRLTTDSLQHAYAYTVDLSQGSEWDVVVIVLTDLSNLNSTFLNRHRLYTAMTRARKKLILIADENRLHSISKTLAVPRYDGLASRLKQLRK